MRTKLAFGTAIVFAMSLVSNAHADMMSFTTVAGSDSDGPLAATISFTAINGGIKVVITNTESGTLAKGQAVSSLAFMMSGLATPTAFTEFMGESFNPTSGSSWTLASGSSFDDTSVSLPPNAIDHWGFSPSGSNVLLATVNSPVPGAGNPHFMILPGSGTAGPGNSLSNSNFFPFEIGPGTFFLTDSAVTANTVLAGHINTVEVGFGTGPDKTLDTRLVPSVPEPASILLFVTVLGLVFGVVSRRSQSA